MVTHIVFAVLLGISTQTLARPTVCEGPESSTVFEACMLNKETDNLDKKLDAAYQKLLKRYAKEGLSAERQKLAEAQRAWSLYLAKTCDFENQTLGGSLSISWLRCRHRLTSERIQYLSEF